MRPFDADEPLFRELLSRHPGLLADLQAPAGAEIEPADRDGVAVPIEV